MATIQPTIRLEADGRRVYVVGNTFPLKAALADAGAHWDAARRQWWIGTGKQTEMQTLIERVNARAAEDADKVDPDAPVVRARVSYRGKTYYAVAMGQRTDGSSYFRLCFRDGSRVFWAAKGEPVEVLKSYGRTDRYSGRTVYPSLNSLQAYAERMKRERETGECECRCHRSDSCACPGFCHIHFDGCDSCGCEA